MSNQTSTMTPEQELELLRAENLRLKAAATRNNKLSLKVGDKGGVSVYGLGRFPITLYREQWDRLLGFSVEISDFILANQSQLTTKASAMTQLVSKR